MSILERGHLSLRQHRLGIGQGKEGRARKGSVAPWGHLILEQHFPKLVLHMPTILSTETRVSTNKGPQISFGRNVSAY